MGTQHSRCQHIRHSFPSRHSRYMTIPTETPSTLPSPATFDLPPSRVNDFAFKIGTVNGTGSASANSLLMQAIFRMGIPISGKNVFPSNIQGLPTWYEI